MPEGHTIHRLARDHHSWFAGQKLAVFSPQGRFAIEAETLNGKRLQRVAAHGKHLFYFWSSGDIVHVHLGLYGKFRLHKNPAPAPRGAVRLRAIGQERTFDLNGPNCCQCIGPADYQSICDRLGPDPLDDEASFDRFADRMNRSRAAIGSLLLNQSAVAGIGNVYRAELLFLCRLHPEIPANRISPQQLHELWQLAGRLLRIGVKYNRINTVDRQSVSKPLSRLNAGERLHIYKRAQCPNCQSAVRTGSVGQSQDLLLPKVPAQAAPVPVNTIPAAGRHMNKAAA